MSHVEFQALNPPITFDVPDIQVTLPREPKLAIIIPSKNRNDLLFTCIDSILEQTQYRNYKIYMADTGSTPEVLAAFKQRYGHHEHIELIKFNFYNYAKINNMVAKHMVDTDTELLLFCNNDIKMLNDAISIMVQTYLDNETIVGTVGARLHYASGQLQHLGIVFTNEPRCPLTHWMAGKLYHPIEQQKYIISYGNTAAFMLISRNLFGLVHGYNEGYRQCFEDAELNLQLLAMGKKHLLPVQATCFHFESQTRRQVEQQNLDPHDLSRMNQFIDTHRQVIETNINR